MGRHSKKRRVMRHNPAFKKSLVWGILIAAAVPGVLSTAVLYDHVRQSWDGLAADTAVLSAMYTVPDRAFEQLRERFAQPSDPQQPEQEQEKAQQPLIPPQRQEEQPPPTKTQPPPEPVEIPEEYRGTVVEEDLAAAGSSLCFGSGRIKNATSLSEQQVEEYLAQPQPFLLDRQGPQVLIMHTHATESYEDCDAAQYDTRNTWRSTDNNRNMVAVGNAIEEELRKAGIGVVHDTQQFDYPSYNGSYDRAAAVVRDYLTQYPEIQLVLDIHRDGIQRDATTIVKPATEIDGKPAAQIMILCGSAPSVGDWGENLRTAAAVQNLLESRYPTLTRPLYFSTGRYNMDLSGGTILLEIGSQANTLEEALHAARLAGQALGDWLHTLAGSA